VYLNTINKPIFQG